MKGQNRFATLKDMDRLVDNKDWSWVLDRPCADCGFEAGAMALEQVRPLLTAAVASLLGALAAPNASTRPLPTTWSPLEYAYHVRDTCDIFRDRILLMLEEDNPTFSNWDQDATALEMRYDLQDPQIVAKELPSALSGLLEQIDLIPEDAWGRPALRSNGSKFTLASLIRYLVHDPIHHAHDVAKGAKS